MLLYVQKTNKQTDRNEKRERCSSYLEGRGNMSLAGEVVAGEDEIVLFKSECFSQNDGVEVGNVSSARRHCGHGLHMPQMMGCGNVVGRWWFHAPNHLIITSAHNAAAATGAPTPGFKSGSSPQRRRRSKTKRRRSRRNRIWNWLSSLELGKRR